MRDHAARSYEFRAVELTDGRGRDQGWCVVSQPGGVTVSVTADAMRARDVARGRMTRAVWWRCRMRLVYQELAFHSYLKQYRALRQDRDGRNSKR